MMGFAQKATGFHRTGLGTNDKPHRASQLLCPGIDLKGVAFEAQTITNKKIPETVSFAHSYYIFFRTNVHGTRESMERFTPFRSFHIAGCGLEEIARNLPERPPAIGKIAKNRQCHSLLSRLQIDRRRSRSMCPQHICRDCGPISGVQFIFVVWANRSVMKNTLIKHNVLIEKLRKTTN